MTGAPAASGMAPAHVFIVTYGRSGSTLLQNLLNALPGYCIRGENNDMLFHLARAWAALAFNEPTLAHRRQGRTLGPEHPWYGGEQVDPDALGAGLAELFTRQVLRPPPDVRVAGFKEIRWHQHPRLFGMQMSFIERFFPDAKFVFNTRDHAAVRRSGWWASQDPARVEELLTRAERLFARRLEHRPERGLRMRYEDYAGDPDGFRPLFDFLGEPFDPALAERVLSRRLTHLAPGSPGGPPA